MEKRELLYEGKAKKVYLTDDPDVVIVDYKDDATAFNGLKKGTIAGKGTINNRMTNKILCILENNGIPTHYIDEIDDTQTAVKKVEIIPLEVIVRNIAAGSFSKRLGIEEGQLLEYPAMEFSYKSDELGDPFISSYDALAIGIVSEEELNTLTELTFQINNLMKDYFAKVGIELVDFKIEFGRFHGQVILADEISPDTCRLWDINTHEKLDKDRFRADMGGVEGAYREVYHRLGLDQ